MKVMTNKRHEYIQALIDILPRKILAPFGFNVKGFEHTPLMIITNKKENIKNPSVLWQIRTNKNIHAKVALGARGFIIGSWNFTESSTKSLHEASVKVDGFNSELNDYFEELWKRSKEVNCEYTGAVEEGGV